MSAKNVLHIFEKIDTEDKAYWLGFMNNGSKYHKNIK